MTDDKSTQEQELIIWAFGGDIDRVRELLDGGLDVNAHGVAGQTALHAAASKGNNEIVTLLLDRGADVNAKDEIGATPLNSAALNNHQDTVAIIKGSGGIGGGVRDP